MTYIGELAMLTGVQVRTLRFWTDLGVLQAGRTESGYRVYGPEAPTWVAFIRSGQALGLSLKTIGGLLRAAEQPERPCDGVQQELVHRLEDVQAQLALLRAVEEVITTQLQSMASTPCDESGCRYVPRRDLPVLDSPDGWRV